MPGAGGALIPGEEEEEGGVRLVGESLVPVGCSPGASRHPQAPHQNLFQRSLIRPVTLTLSDDMSTEQRSLTFATVRVAIRG